MLRSLWSTSILPLILLVIVIGDPVISAVAPSGQKYAYVPLPAEPNTRFEVGSIKTSGPDEHGSGLYTYTGARVVERGMTVHYLIAEAYRIDESQTIGGPAWIDGIPQSLRELGLELKRNTGTVYKLAVDQVSLLSSN